MGTIVRTRERHSHVAITSKKIDEVADIAREYQALRREIVHQYWAHKHLQIVIHNPMGVITARRKSGEAKLNPLVSDLQAQAVLDGLNVLRGSWEQVFTKVRSQAARKFNEHERHEINWLLRWPKHIVSILEGVTVIPTNADGLLVEKLAYNNHAKLCKWLGAALRKHRPGQPTLKRKLSFEVNTNCMRVSQRVGKLSVWIAVSGLTKGRRVRLPLAGSDLEFLDGTANLRISIEPDTRGVRRVVFRRAVKIKVVERVYEGAVGLDKGANIAIAATASDAEHAVLLGQDAGEVLTRRSGRSFRRMRSRLATRADKLAGRHTPSGRFHGNPNPAQTQRAKARRIRKNNLGTKRRDRAQRAGEAEMKNLAGRAARELMDAFPTAAVFYEEKLNFKGANARRPKKTNRKLNRWMKRELSDAINRHVSAKIFVSLSMRPTRPRRAPIVLRPSEVIGRVTRSDACTAGISGMQTAWQAAMCSSEEVIRRSRTTPLLKR